MAPAPRIQTPRHSRLDRHAAPSRAATPPHACRIRAYRSTDKEEAIHARLEGLTLLTANNRAAAQSALRATRRSARSGQCYDPVRHAALRRLVAAYGEAFPKGGLKLLPSARHPADGA
ncbi:hypothetical protein [Roseixanthobacter glucoisosaccharinicivorans]|uniref:hypothetical protein n=1 Tax=Roseixanthobacter glucoisosaccharinicivorans TaxID=3119923 RepID=UPI003727DA1B